MYRLHCHKSFWNQRPLFWNQRLLLQDVLTLENLMVIAYNLKIKDTPFNDNLLPEPVLPEIPFDVDMKTVEKIRRKYRYVFQNPSYC
jgi:hypothetical protein